MISMPLVRNLLIVLSMVISASGLAEDGYRLWLRYDKIDNSNLMQQYRTAISYIQFARSSPTLDAAKKEMLIV